uniref:Uncharacterized protein n=1 Tax=Tanacetum cinerariifolium TaxID=118510 RepID=A0A6L2ML84_TANCI|nr:hypothetical protein [Tanacetum cinerariifolium]
MSSDSTASLLPDHPLTHTTPVLVPSLCRTARMAVRLPPTMSHGLFASIAYVAAMSDSAFHKMFRSSYDSLPSPILPVWKRYREDKGPTTGDERLAVSDGCPVMRVESLGLGGVETMPKGQQRAALVVETAVGKPLGLYGVLRHQEIAPREGQMPSVFEVGHGFGSVPEPERLEGVLALKHPTLTTWIDLEDGRTYIDVLAYPPPAPPVQTLPSLEWSSSLLPISPAPFIVPSPMISLTVPSSVASPATAEAEGFLNQLGA